jgi:hypothetical protein
MINAKKALTARPVPIRMILSQLGFKLVGNAVKQEGSKRVRHFPLQIPISRDPAFLLSQLAFCHWMNPPAK